MTDLQLVARNNWEPHLDALEGEKQKVFFFYNKQIIVGHLINNIALAIERRMAND